MFKSIIVLAAVVAVASASGLSQRTMFDSSLKGGHYSEPIKSASYQAPVQSYQAPVQSYQAPVQSYQAPVQSYQAPVQSYQAPIKSSYQAPVQSYQAPIQSYQAPVQSYQAPVQSYQAPTKSSYQAPVQSYQAPMIQAAKGLEAPRLESFQAPRVESYQAPALELKGSHFEGGLKGGFRPEHSYSSKGGVSWTQPELQRSVQEPMRTVQEPLRSQEITRSVEIERPLTVQSTEIREAPLTQSDKH